MELDGSQQSRRRAGAASGELAPCFEQQTILWCTKVPPFAIRTTDPPIGGVFFSILSSSRRRPPPFRLVSTAVNKPRVQHTVTRSTAHATHKKKTRHVTNATHRYAPPHYATQRGVGQSAQGSAHTTRLTHNQPLATQVPPHARRRARRRGRGAVDSEDAEPGGGGGGRSGRGGGAGRWGGGGGG